MYLCKNFQYEVMDIARKVQEALKDALTGDNDNKGIIVPMTLSLDGHIKGSNKSINVGSNYKLVKKLSIWNEYGIVSDDCSDAVARGLELTGYVVKIFAYIKKYIYFNSNVIYIDKRLLSTAYCNGREVNRRCFADAIAYFVRKGILQYTDKQSTFIVNPIHIFKGDIHTFVNIYNKHFSNSTILTENNQVVINRFVILRKNQDGDYIDTEVPKVKKA